MAHATTPATRDLIARATREGKALRRPVDAFAASLTAAVRAFDAEIDALGLPDRAYRGAVRSSGLGALVEVAIHMHETLGEAISQG